MAKDTRHRYPCVFILGMHRSGTSCLAGMLNDHGLFLGDVSRVDRFNAKGNQESREIRRINNQLLNAAGGAWYLPLIIDDIPPQLALRMAAFRRSMEKTQRPWGIKDPRMLYCLDHWFKPGDSMVGTFRHPAVAAVSLEHRNQAKPAHRQVLFANRQWQELWYRYNCRLVTLYEQQPFPVVNFDWAASRYRAAVAQAARRLGLTGRAEAFFDPALRHQRHHRRDNERGIILPACRNLYRRLITMAEAEESKGKAENSGSND